MVSLPGTLELGFPSRRYVGRGGPPGLRVPPRANFHLNMLTSNSPLTSGRPQCQDRGRLPLPCESSADAGHLVKVVPGACWSPSNHWDKRCSLSSQANTNSFPFVQEEQEGKTGAPTETLLSHLLLAWACQENTPKAGEMGLSGRHTKLPARLRSSWGLGQALIWCCIEPCHCRLHLHVIKDPYQPRRKGRWEHRRKGSPKRRSANMRRVLRLCDPH